MSRALRHCSTAPTIATIQPSHSHTTHLDCTKEAGRQRSTQTHRRAAH